LLAGGLALGLALAKRPGAAEAGRDQRRQKLLDELVELEQAGVAGHEARREAILGELERLWERS
jgi:hypothetical protein